MAKKRKTKAYALQQEHGSKGGKKIVEKYGNEHFSKMAKKRWAKVKREKAKLSKAK